jgi:hypothetical protein
MNSCKRDPSGIAGYSNCLTGGILCRRTVDGAIHASLRRPAEDFVGSFRWFEHHLSSNSLG